MLLQDRIYHTINPYMTQASIHLSQSRTLTDIQSYTGINKVHLALAAYLILSFLLFLDPFHIGAPFAANIIALAYPIHASLRASINNNLDLLKLWVLYFSVYGVVTGLVDIVGRVYIPYYFVFKSALLVSLYWSHSYALKEIYSLVVVPSLTDIYLDKKQ
ncbi:hypothetical protein BDV3_003796 [Batrachochytrium dendrobatidis]|nr:hypothetical protein O5D80_005577 [Batrachochytrium dendrobatidis]KAK5669712.1 hypothetical protein QVD99_004099 [Batrachochytrium dendrobatidis]